MSHRFCPPAISTLPISCRAFFFVLSSALPSPFFFFTSFPIYPSFHLALHLFTSIHSFPYGFSHLFWLFWLFVTLSSSRFLTNKSSLFLQSIEFKSFSFFFFPMQVWLNKDLKSAHKSWLEKTFGYKIDDMWGRSKLKSAYEIYISKIIQIVNYQHSTP